jgi:hypothetical protein
LASILASMKIGKFRISYNVPERKECEDLWPTLVL